MKPIPFNLERAKAGDPILINGTPATFGAHNPDAREYARVVAWDSGGSAWAVSDKGLSKHGEVVITMAPKKHVRWANFYPNRKSVCDHESKEKADECADGDRIACVRVEFEEGEGL